MSSLRRSLLTCWGYRPGHGLVGRGCDRPACPLCAFRRGKRGGRANRMCTYENKLRTSAWFSRVSMVTKRRLFRGLPLERTGSTASFMAGGCSDTRRGGRGGGSGTTVGQIHRTVRRMLNDAVRWGLIRVNPAVGAHIPRTERRPLDTRTLEEIRAFLEATNTDRLRPLWKFALHTGMRLGSWSNIGLHR